MKKLSLSLLLLAASVSMTNCTSNSSTQQQEQPETTAGTANEDTESAEHLTFMGIPIKGSMTSFCKKLQSKGFTKLESDNSQTALRGEFTGRKAIVCVMSNNNGNDTYFVGVLLNSTDDWSKLMEDYTYYKELYTKKYGEPAICTEQNNANHHYIPGTEMYDLRDGYITYECGWEVTGGTIDLSITKSPDRHREGLIRIQYYDVENTASKIKNDLDEI